MSFRVRVPVIWFLLSVALPVLCSVQSRAQTNGGPDLGGNRAASPGVPPVLSIQRQGPDTVVISFLGEPGDTLQSTASISGPWTDVPGGMSPFITPINGGQRFFRVRTETGIYSANIVGWVNAVMRAGQNLIANPFRGPSRVQDLFFPPEETQIVKGTDNGASCAFFEFSEWFDCGFGLPTLTLRAGEGAILNTPETFVTTYIGEIAGGGSFTNNLPAGWSLCSSIIPQIGLITSDLLFPAEDGDVIYRFNPSIQTYDTYVYSVDTWFPSEPVIFVGEAFWVLASTPRRWVRSFDEPGSGGFTINSPLLMASVAAPPQTLTTNIGASAAFDVTGFGSPNLRYQWRRNGINLVGQTNSILTIAQGQLADGGTYTVIVADEFGATISTAAPLVLVAPEVSGANHFTNRVRISGTNGLISGSNDTATKEPGEPAIAGERGGHSVWYVWNAPTNGIATFTTSGSAFDTLLGVYQGNVVSNLTLVTSDDDAAGSFTSVAKLNVVRGLDYAIAVDGLDGASGYYLLKWTVEPTAAQLPVIVTQPADATVAPGASNTFTVVTQGPVLQHTFQWFFNDAAFIGATNQTLTVTNAGAAVVGDYFVRITRAGLTIQSRSASLQINVAGEETQAVRAFDKMVDALDSSSPLRLGNAGGAGLSRKPPLAAGSVVRGYTGTQVFNNYGATSEGGEEIHCGTICGTSKWLPFVPEESGMLYVNTAGSLFDTVLALYIRSGASRLARVACDNDGGPNRTSAMQARVEAGVTNFIVIDGVAGAYGVLHLNYSLVTAGTLTVLEKTNGPCRLRVTGHPGMKFSIQASSNLVHWDSLPGPVITSPASFYDLTDTAASTAATRFYRAVMVP